MQTLPQPREGEQIADLTGQKDKAFYLAFDKARANVNALVEKRNRNLTDEMRQRLDTPQKIEAQITKDIPEVRQIRMVDQFFLTSYLGLNSKTRSIISFMYENFLFSLLCEPFNSLFCKSGSTFTPNDSLRSKIILLNLPTKIYYEAGQEVQTLFKLVRSRAMERRDLKLNNIPVFLGT